MLLKMFIRHDRVCDNIDAINDLVKYVEDIIQCRHKNLMMLMMCRANCNTNSLWC